MMMEWLESNIFNTILIMGVSYVAWLLKGLNHKIDGCNQKIDEERRETNRKFEAHERRLDDLYSSFYGPLMRATKDTK